VNNCDCGIRFRVGLPHEPQQITFIHSNVR